MQATQNHQQQVPSRPNLGSLYCISVLYCMYPLMKYQLLDHKHEKNMKINKPRKFTTSKCIRTYMLPYFLLYLIYCTYFITSLVDYHTYNGTREYFITIDVSSLITVKIFKIQISYVGNTFLLSSPANSLTAPVKSCSQLVTVLILQCNIYVL